MVGSRTFPPNLLHPTGVCEIVRTDNAGDSAAKAPPVLPTRRSSSTERERCARRRFASGARMASARDRTPVRRASSSVNRGPARRHAERTTTMHNRLSRYYFPHGIPQLLRREPPHHGDDAIVAANGMKSKGK